MDIASRLHSIDIGQLHLPKRYISTMNYYERQLRVLENLGRKYSKTKSKTTGRELGYCCDFERALRFFKATYPKHYQPVLVHGDCKIDNLVRPSRSLLRPLNEAS
jgi:aminoglycoside phosphotransferase (APT) family kinase protein